MFGEWPYRPLVIDMIVVMIRIGLILERRRRLLSLRYPRLSATGSGKHTAVEVALVRHKDLSWRMTISGFESPIAAPIKA